jgi:DNA-binding CsgD family transcriptional regulator
MMSCLKPVLELAVRLKLGTAVGLLDAAARRGEAVALLGSRGDILQANEPFEAMLGTRLMLKGRRLSVRNADDDRRLQALITHCIQPPSTDAAGPIPAFIGPENGRLLITCHAITGVAQDLLALARGILFVEEVSRPKLLSDGSRLRAAFGLSPAETRLAVRLAGGQALRTAAEAEQVTYETARTRLKAIFQKTGVNRQSELVVLVGKLFAHGSARFPGGQSPQSTPLDPNMLGVMKVSKTNP